MAEGFYELSDVNDQRDRDAEPARNYAYILTIYGVMGPSQHAVDGIEIDEEMIQGYVVEPAPTAEEPDGCIVTTVVTFPSSVTYDMIAARRFIRLTAMDRFERSQESVRMQKKFEQWAAITYPKTQEF